MKHITLLTTGLCVAALLLGCVDHSKDYLKNAQSIPPLVIPSSVPPIKQKALYPMPHVSYAQLPKQSTSLKPPTMEEKYRSGHNGADSKSDGAR